MESETLQPDDSLSADSQSNLGLMISNCGVDFAVYPSSTPKHIACVQLALRAMPLISIAALLFSSQLLATSIVAVRTRSAIFIGSDSKLIDGEGKAVGSTCKVMTHHGAAFAVARIWSSPAQDFSVTSVAAEALSSSRDLATGVRLFERLLIEPLERLLRALKTTDPQRFERELTGHSAVDAVFVGFEGRDPALFVTKFVVNRGTSQSIKLRVQREECARHCTEPLAFVTLGQHSAIDKALSDDPDFWNIGFAEGIRRLINLETLSVPTLVGPPISILSMDKSGAHWIEPGECEDR